MKRCNSSSNTQKGFTIVEVLVAALLILLMIMGASAAMRSGQQVSALDRQRNIVRQEIISILEKAEYMHSNFELLVETNGLPGTQIVLDDRGTTNVTDDLKANSITSVIDTSLMIDSKVVPFKRIRSEANWSSLDGADTLILEKWICNIQYE